MNLVIKTGIKSICILAVLFLAACNPRSQQNEKSFSQQRAETDTVLAFQGIRISEPLDFARYEELINNLPVILYRENRDSFTFPTILINGLNNAQPGDIVHSLSIYGQIDKYYDYLSFFCMYEDNYGCFSFYKRFNQNDECMGTFHIGEKSKYSDKTWTRQDAVNDFLEYGNSSSYKFLFVWEWKNQTIILSYNPRETFSNHSVTYLDKGYAQRKDEEERKQRLKDAEERQIDDAIRRQQI